MRLVVSCFPTPARGRCAAAQVPSAPGSKVLCAGLEPKEDSLLRNKRPEGSRRDSARASRVARFLGLTGLGGFAILGLFGILVLSGRAECAAAVAQVRISPLVGFIPSSLTVKSGNTVTWVNDGEFPHTVTSPEGAFASQAIQREKAFSFRFDAPGTSRTSPASSPRLPARLLFAEVTHLALDRPHTNE